MDAWPVWVSTAAIALGVMIVYDRWKRSAGKSPCGCGGGGGHGASSGGSEPAPAIGLQGGCTGQAL